MAKRKRLTAPRADFLAPPGADARPAAGPDPAALTRAPIAQVAGDAAQTAAAGELAALVASARAEGRLAQTLPLDAVDPEYLVRDRIALDPEPLEELMQSLRARGQRTPIEVVDLGAEARPRYGLVSGWRRLNALRRLAAEDPAFARVAAIVRLPEGASEAYLSMVEENEIRVGLSFYERARIVRKALDEGVFDDPKTALQTLFANVSRAKRSKIKSFMGLVAELDHVLRYPSAISERLGLALVQVLEDRRAAAALTDDLAARPAATREEEIARLTEAVERASPGAVSSGPPSSGPSPVPSLAPSLAPPEAGAEAAPKARPLPVRAAPPERLALTVSHEAGGPILVAGPGADADLLDDLKIWLRLRGHPLA